MKKYISVFLVAAAGSLVAFVALLRVVVVVVVGMGVLVFLSLLGLVSLDDWLGKGLLSLELFFFDDVDGRNGADFLLFRPCFLLFVNRRHCF